MSIFFSLFSSGLSCLFYGLIIAAILILIFYGILQLIRKDLVRSIGFYISGILLFFIFWINSAIFCGSWKIKGVVNFMEEWLTSQISGLKGYVNLEEGGEIVDEIEQKFPMLDSFYGSLDFTGIPYDQLPAMIATPIYDKLNNYMLTSFLWIIGAFLCGIAVVMFFNKGRSYSSSPRRSRQGRYEEGYSSDSYRGHRGRDRYVPRRNAYRRR